LSAFPRGEETIMSRRATFAAAAVVALSTTWVFAQEDRPPAPATPPTVEDLQRQIDKLKKDVNALNIALNQAYDRLEQISEADPTGSGFTPRILANMATNPRFRDEVERVTQAKLRFRNQAAFEPILYVNGVAWRVQTGNSYLPVPRDSVTVGDAFGESFIVRFDPGIGDQTITITAEGTVIRPTAVASAPRPAE
jgi:hypothetical protein